MTGQLAGTWYSLEVPGDPVPKARPRVGRNGHVYTPRRTIAAEQAMAWALRVAGVHFAPDAEIVVAAHFYRRTRHRVDVDNLLKLVLDAATLAGCWADDSQVRDVWGTVELGSPAPRTAVTLARAGHQLTPRRPR